MELLTNRCLFALLLAVAALIFGPPLIMFLAGREREAHPDQYAAWEAEYDAQHPTPPLSRPPSWLMTGDAHSRTGAREEDDDAEQPDPHMLDLYDTGVCNVQPEPKPDRQWGWTRVDADLRTGRRSVSKLD